ncbi:PilN domain-containing protein [bacterium]|nr:PilN domain-containing protein [bacterium]
MKEINLIPKDIQFRIRWSYRRIFFTTSVTLACAIAIAWLFMNASSSYYEVRFENDQKLITRMDDGKAKMTKVYGNLEEITRDRKTLKKAAGALCRFMSDRILWSGILGDLSRQNFSGSWFERIQVVEEKKGEQRTRKLIIRGSSINKNSIARLMNVMEGYPLFSNIKLEDCRRGMIDRREAYKFFITCEVAK